jgi:hypothetical protein
MEKHIARNLESCLNRINNDLINVSKLDLTIAEIHMEFYYDHVKKYGSSDIQKYYDLRNRYSKLIKWNGRIK